MFALVYSTTSFLIDVIPYVLIIIGIIKIVQGIVKYKKYKDSSYYNITRHPYFSLRRDLGKYGEYLVYDYLKHMEAHGAKFLFNVYIPRKDGKTSEIDVLIICSKGIFVIESKNYSGWIFGSENQRNWCQTLPVYKGSQKEHFYNPIMQNRTHIKHLTEFLGDPIPMYSIIAFSERCTLKSVQIDSDNVSVINRYDIADVVSDIINKNPFDALTELDVSEIYDELYPYTQVDENTKKQHIANIQENMEGRSSQEFSLISTIPTASKNELTENIEINKTEISTTDTADSSQTIEDSAIESAKTHNNNTVEPMSPKPKCPICNGNLILRTATRGANIGRQFYGCSNYPKCKYIQNISNKTV